MSKVFPEFRNRAVVSSGEFPCWRPSGDRRREVEFYLRNICVLYSLYKTEQEETENVLTCRNRTENTFSRFLTRCLIQTESVRVCSLIQTV